MKKYEETVEYLDTFLNYEKKGFKGGETFDLGGMRTALRKMGYPDRDYVSAHIAGTKGKGSVSTFAASILRSSGMRTGLYTSPHLSTPRERIRVNGKMISKAEFTDGLEYLKKILGKNAPGKLTYFEIFTLLAMWYFKTKKVEAAIFETGMGGRLDATNVIKPIVCGITPISYDHTRVLGRSLGKIAGEKAGIIKKGVVCVSSPQRSNVLKVIKERCDELDVSLLLAGKDLRVEIKEIRPEGTIFNITTPLKRYEDCRTGMPGEFQPENVLQAVIICEEIWKRTRPGEIKEHAVTSGIKKAFLMGRMEVLSSSPLIIIDGAQNSSSAERLVRSVRKTFDYNKLVLIAAFCEDKDIKGSCTVLSDIADVVIVTRARTSRYAEPKKIAGYFPGKKVIIAETVKDAITRAMVMAKKKDLVLSAGSFYLAGEIREIVKGKAVK